MVVAAGDHLTVSDLSVAAYGRANEPKLPVLPGGHFEAYVGDGFRTSAPHSGTGSWCTGGKR